MNRNALERHLRACGCFLHHHGGKHDIWFNPITGNRSPVPRHPTLKRGTAKGICRMLQIPLPSGL